MSDCPLLGPLVLDIEGIELKADERDMLTHPACGGLILFTRNYESREQLAELMRSIRQLRPDLLVYIDQEGGRVQRLRDGFLSLPALRTIGDLYDRDPEAAFTLARHLAWLMATELRALDIDVSFAPVLDLDYGNSEVIGDRALHRKPEAVALLAKRYVQGMHEAGMPAVGKHYPGHGFVAADSHAELPVDERSLDDMRQSDLIPFTRAVAFGIDAFMMAHVVYPAVDDSPASFSRRWIGDLLRTQAGFDGLIFSDDLSMQGALQVASSVEDRAVAALQAGCDVVLVCNDAASAQRTLESLESVTVSLDSQRRLARFAKACERTDTGSDAFAQWKRRLQMCQQQGVLV